MAGDKTTFNSVLETAVFSENDVQSLSQEDSLHIASQRVNLTKQSFKQESFNEFISTASSKYISVDEQAKSSRRDLLSAKKVHKEGLKKRGYRLSSKILGQGAFGTAYKVYSLDVHHPRQELACKIMLLRKEKMSEKAYISSLHSFTNEVQVMQACSSHENVVSIREHFIDSHEDGLVHGYILMDFASLGSLHSKLMSSGPFEERVALDYFQQTASALEHLHLRGIGKLIYQMLTCFYSFQPYSTSRPDTGQYSTSQSKWPWSSETIWLWPQSEGLLKRIWLYSTVETCRNGILYGSRTNWMLHPLQKWSKDSHSPVQLLWSWPLGSRRLSVHDALQGESISGQSTGGFSHWRPLFSLPFVGPFNHIAK